MTRVALAPHPILGPRMAGPGWRYVHLARALAGAGAEVTLLAPPGSVVADPGPVRVVEVPPAKVGRALEGFEVLVTQGIFASPLRDGPALARVRLVYDFYDPLPVELPEHYRVAPAGKDPEARYRFNLRRHAFLVGTADAFLVANAPQRDLLVGTAVAVGRLRVADFADDPGLGRTFLEVPCGTEPVAAPSPAPGRLDLAWGGGTWGWFDVPGALAALGALRAHDARYRLVFPGLSPPGPEARLAASDPRAEAARLGLPPAALEVVEGWSERPAFLARLAACRVGLSLAGAGIEARFAHRTRVLDYLSAGLPCVMTRGDVLAEEGAREGWARVVEPGRPGEVAAAVRALAEDGPERSRALEGVRAGAAARTWARAAAPLAAWIAAPAASRRKPGWAWAALAHQLRRLPALG